MKNYNIGAASHLNKIFQVGEYRLKDIKTGKSRHTDNIDHKTAKQNITQKTKEMSNTNTTKNPGLHSCLLDGREVTFSFKIYTVLLK